MSTTQLSSDSKRQLARFVGVSIVIPTIIYVVLRHHLSINSEAEELLAGFLGILGMALFFLPQA